MNQSYYGGAPNQGAHYPPPNQPYGAHPPLHNAHGSPPPQNQYGPPQGQWNQPPQGQYNQPPQGQYNQPPPGQFHQQPYQDQSYGYNQQPQQGYGVPPAAPAPPSPGYVPGQTSHMDMSRTAHDLRQAMKGIGTDEKALIRILATIGPLEIHSVKAAYATQLHRDLVKDVHSETSNHFREGLLAILRGPLEQDCHVLHEAMTGLGTKGTALNDVLLSRSNADMQAIKAHYQHMYHRSLEQDVNGDLSGKTERLFNMVLSARRNEESAPLIPQQIDADVTEIYKATEGRVGADQLTMCSILSSRSDGQIRAIAQQYKLKYHRSLDEVIRKEFTGHIEQALLFMLRHAEDPAKHDADLLEDAMKGIGTRDSMLIRRIVMIHWNPDRLHQCKAAYKHFYKRDLADRVRGETRGDYERLMLACLGAAPALGQW